LTFSGSCLVINGGRGRVATIGFKSADCDVDFAAIVARSAIVLEPPQNRPYGARVAYLQGPGALKVELEQMLALNS